jgi:uncharacterized membrane protein YfcA
MVQRFVALFFVALLPAAWFYDHLVGIRAFGVAGLVGATYLFRGGKISFDRRPGEPLRDWPRWLSLSVAFGSLAFGVLCLSVPASVLSALCSSPYHRCT